MWRYESKHLPPAVSRLEPEEVLYFYDGPVVFSVNTGFTKLLFIKTDELENSNIFIGCSISRAKLNALRIGTLSLRGALSADEYIFLEINYNLEVQKEWLVLSSEVPEDFIPDAGLGLLTKFGKVSDQIGVESFMSYYYYGKRMQEGEIPLTSFKSIFDSTYESFIKIFDRNVFKASGGKNRPEFKLYQPILASLRLEIGLPHMGGDEYLRDTIESQREEFFSKLNEVVDRAKNNSLEYGFASQNFDTLLKVNAVVPGGRQIVDTLELGSGRIGKDDVVINEAVGGRIKRAFADTRKSAVQKSGIVVEINSESKTFLMKSDSQRLVTCVFSSEAEFKKNPLVIGNLVSLNGRLVERDRRDKIYVQGDVKVK